MTNSINNVLKVEGYERGKGLWRSINDVSERDGRECWT